jgi:transposase
MAMNEQKVLSHLKIISLSEENLTPTEISLKMNIPRKTVSNVIHKYRKYGTVLRLPGSGRRRSLDDKDVGLILTEIEKDPFTSSEKITNVISQKSQKNVSSRTVRNYIRTTSYRSWVPRKLPYLSEKNIAKRLELCKKWSSFEQDDWDKIIWSDETKINLFSSDGRKRVFRKVGEAYKAKYSRSTVKHGGGSIMIWGCMSSKGVGKLVVIKGIMDKLYYKSILTKNLRPSAVKMGLANDFTFQQDNDPKHTSAIVKDYFTQKDIKVLDWPSQSPDLNPIEHLWDHLKREVKKVKVKNLKELEAEVKKIWNNITKDVCSNLVNTMNDRVNAVIRADGGHIPY